MKCGSRKLYHPSLSLRISFKVDCHYDIYYNCIMQEVRNSTLNKYMQIDWSKPASKLYRSPITMLSEHEAHTLNNALAMNRTTLRYIKL